MTKQEFILNHFLASNANFCSTVSRKYPGAAKIKIGPSTACLNGLIGLPSNSETLCENINVIVILSHLALILLNGSREFESGNLTITDSFYGYSDFQDIKIYYLGRPILSLNSSSKSKTFTHEAFPLFSDDRIVAQALSKLGELAHI